VKNTAYPPPNPEDARPAAGRRLAGERVLLYVRALDMEPVRGLTLAAKSLEGGPASPSEAMDALALLLEKEGLPAPSGRPEAPRLASSPPVNRRSMKSAEMDRLPWRTSIASYFKGLFRAYRGRQKE
jgi:hypothetical protein